MTETRIFGVTYPSTMTAEALAPSVRHQDISGHIHWISTTNGSLVYTMKDFKYLMHLRNGKFQKKQTYITYFLKCIQNDEG